MARGHGLADTGGRQGRRLPLRALLTGQGISLLGNTLTGLAVPWFVLETTGSASRTGLVAFAGMLPTVIGGIVGGAVVDRLGHRRTSVLADLASGATVATIPLLHATVGLAFWQLLGLVFLGALLDSPGHTARIAILPDLAARAGMPLERANAAGQTIGSVSTLVGPPVAGGLIVLLGPSNVLWLDAASFAVSAALMALAAPAGRSQRAEADRDPAQGFLAEVTEGLRLVVNDRLLRGILGPAMVINFLAAPLFGVVLPVFAARVYGEALDLGLLLAGVGAGSVVGSVAYGALGPSWSRRRTLVAAFLLSGLPFWALALTPPLPIAVALLAAVGLFLAPINPLVISAIQRRTPEALLGRVIGAVIALASVLAPLGMLTAGAALETIGVSTTLVVIAAGFLVVGASLIFNPVFAELDRPSPPTEARATEDAGSG